MCRLYGFRATEPTKVECTLVIAQNALLVQSRSDLRGKEHADGWGIACYEDGTPDVRKSELAAYRTLHFSTAAERVHARTVIAHVRRATVARPSLSNTHPFTHGPWTFAHNGTIHGFERVEPILNDEVDGGLSLQRHGSTDSELAFLWLLTRMSAAGVDPDRPSSDLQRLVEVLDEGVHSLAELSREGGSERPAELNFLLTDGHVLVASRWKNTLYWTERRGLHDCEVCGIPHVHHEPGADYRAVVVASEPISHETWREVPDGAVLAIDDAAQPRLHPA